MTSEQIQATAPTDVSTNAWLKLIAFQLASLTEALRPVEMSIPEKRGPGRPRKVQ